jgi:hypothetical protein
MIRWRVSELAGFKRIEIQGYPQGAAAYLIDEIFPQEVK